MTVAGAAPPVFADGEMLKIVFQNLLVNSGHAMQGRGTIDVAIAAIDSVCEIVVHRRRAQAFLQRSATRSSRRSSRPSREGPALALRPPSGLIEAHQGEIEVAVSADRRHPRHGPAASRTSEARPVSRTLSPVRRSTTAGRGNFPCTGKIPHPKASHPRESGVIWHLSDGIAGAVGFSADSSRRFTHMPKATILVVDDEALIRWSLTERLHSEGYEVLEADTGKAALEKLPEGVDLVLLDYRLPDTDGVSVLRKIKEFDQDVLVILLTAYASVDTAVEAMKLGAYHFANKPFNLDEVAAIVERALETTRLRREVRQYRTSAARPYSLQRLVGAVVRRSRRCVRWSRAWRRVPRQPSC